MDLMEALMPSVLEAKSPPVPNMDLKVDDIFTATPSVLPADDWAEKSVLTAELEVCRAVLSLEASKASEPSFCMVTPMSDRLEMLLVPVST